MGRHQDYFTTPAVSQTSLFRHLQICILALLSARVLTLRLASPGLSDASAGLCSTFLVLGGAGITKRQENEPEEHSCFSISTFSVCKSLSTNHLTHVDKSVQTFQRYNTWGWGKDSLPHTLAMTSYSPLSALSGKILRVDEKAEAWGPQWSQRMGKGLGTGSLWQPKLVLPLGPTVLQRCGIASLRI